VLDKAKAWQQRALESVHPILYLDALFVSIREESTVTKKAVYLALGMTLDGQRDVLGIWVQGTGGARSVKDIGRRRDAGC
jgi:putative transposase